MTNNQIDSNQEPNRLTNDELEAVAGGAGGEKPVLDAVKDFVGDVKAAGKDLISDIRESRQPG